ncbi:MULTISPECIES: oligosaccharide flippase family protein [unclassified Exiguobacterium]|uniref:lipopolysaccharide biosynthesis protein n=1 Tax=unclassified Exiguobacterium TaxID=2644629 RepID=UPI001BE6A88A|nr:MULTISPECIES: oligosaccharide flippase family protein [unclassified Exiguobacterium]
MATKYALEPEEVSSNQIKYGALVSYVSIGFNIISGFLYTPWMIGKIGQANYGLYILSFSIIAIFAFNLGLEVVVARFLSKYRNDGDRQGEIRFLGIAYKLFFLLTFILAVVLAILYVFLDNLYGNLSAGDLEKLQFMYPIVAFYILITLISKPLDAVFIVNERFIQFNSLLFFEKVVIVTCTIVALVMGYGVYALVVINAIVILLNNIFKVLYIWKYTDTKIDFMASGKGMYREIFVFSSWQTTVAATHNFLMNIMPTVLVIVASGVAVAIFSIGMVVQGYVLLIATAVNSLFLPKVSRLTHSGDVKDIENLMIRVGRIQLYVVGFITVTFIAIGSEFIHFWVGDAFRESYIVASLLIAMGVITLPQEIANIHLVTTNQIRYRAYGMVISAVIGLVLAIFLSGAYGASGAALALMIGYLSGNAVFMNIIYVKILKIDVLRFFKECHLQLLPGLLLTLVIGMVIQHLHPSSNMIEFLYKAVGFVALYAVFTWFFTVNQFEKDLIQSILPFKRIKKGELK